MHVLRNVTNGVEAGGLILDLQVIRPNPIVEANGRIVCDIDGEPLFRTADAAAAALDGAVRENLLADEARDDHDVREHFASGEELISAFAERKRAPPEAALPALRKLGPCAVRERCRLRRLRVR